MENRQNFANDLSYFAQFSWKDDILKFYLQGLKLPDTMVGMTTNYRHGQQVVNVGDSLEFTSIPLNFIMDEKLEIYDLLLDIQEEYRATLKPLDSLDVFIQDNENVTKKHYTFNGIWFLSVDGPQYATTSKSTEIIVTAEMKFQEFNRNRNRVI